MFTLPPENIRVSTSLQEKQRELIIVLLPCHQPIGFDVALSLSLVIAL